MKIEGIYYHVKSLADLELINGMAKKEGLWFWRGSLEYQWNAEEGNGILIRFRKGAIDYSDYGWYVEELGGRKKIIPFRRNTKIKWL